MSEERNPTPIKASKNTVPGASLKKTGSRRVTELLPDILQTTVNKQFLDSTFEQLMSSGSLEPIKHYVGDNIGNGTFNPKVTDNYLLDDRSNDAYQFSPAMVNKNEDGTIDQALAYDDLIRSLKYNEVNTNNHNKILNEPGYTLDLPINYDMFINHHRYYWVLDVLPVNELRYLQADLLDIDTIIGETTYTTPKNVNGRTLTFENGMRIKFAPNTVNRRAQTVAGNKVFTASITGAASIKVFLNNLQVFLTTDYTVNKATGVVTFVNAPAVGSEIEIHSYYTHSLTDEYKNDAIYIVDGVGEPGGIKLTQHFDAGQYDGQQGKRTWLNVTVYNNQEPAGFDSDQFSFDARPFDLREHRMTTRDYTCEQRHSIDQSAWSRSNLWVHEQTIANSLIYQGITNDIYTLDRYRAVRPIIEYKKNIEKHRFGKRHIANVDHYLESADDPATTIIGKTEYSVITSGITDDWAFKGYERGDRVRVSEGVSPNFVVTFWECQEAHAEPLKPTHGENRKYWEQIVPVEVENGDLIIFFGTTETYKNKIWKIGGVGTSITLTETYNFDGSNGATQLVNGDKILLLNGFNTFDFGTLGGFGQGERDAPKSGAELHVDSTTLTGWKYSRQKEHRSQGMPVELYDVNLVKLDTTATYPDNDFAGATIFDFVHSETSDYDDALGFNPEYVDYGNNPGLNFCMEFLKKKFTYVQQSSDFSKSNQLEIPGYYYYKYIDSQLYHNGWSNIRGGQPVMKKIKKVVTDAGNPLKVDLGHASFVGDRCYNIFKEFDHLAMTSQPVVDCSVGRINRVGGKFPTLFFHNNNTYTIRTQFPQAEIEFVDMDGSPIGTGITRTAGSLNTFTLQIGTPTVNSIKYRLVSDPANFGVIFFNANVNETNVKVRKNGKEFNTFSHTGNVLSINSGLIKDDVYEFEFYTYDDYSETGEGQFEVAKTQTLNPQNLEFGDVSYGDLIQHFKTQMTSNPLFTGDWYGTNNYRNIVHATDIGGTIRQQPYSTELLNQLLSDINTNPYSALQFTSANYSLFKEKFKKKLVQLHESLEESLPTYILVDKTLEALNLGKNKDGVFANSQMAMYRDFRSVDSSWVIGQTPTFDLPRPSNKYDDTTNHIQVFVQVPDSAGNHTWRQLQKDWEFSTDDYSVTVTLAGITFPSTGKNNIHIRWYERESVSFVPPSIAKLGVLQPFVPELRDDYSKDSTGTTTDSVLIGHDGSVHIRLGTEIFNRQAPGYNPIDAGLWDLELRIYNNLGKDLDGTISSTAYAPNAHRPSVHSWTELNNTIRGEFNKYKNFNNVTTLNSSTYYDGSDKFTWNYSSVSPNIGGWRGLYHYYFKTDRPHTHPWEMLGHNKRPSWWDANYNWTDATKRSALLLALEFGQISDPALGANKQTYDINYSYRNYDWQNKTLVTTAGVLNDPDTAGVVTTPSLADRQKDFVFGDWGPVEAEWRRSSEGKIATSLAFLRTRPLIALNNYFRTARRTIKNLAGYNGPQELDTDAGRLKSWKNTVISGSSITGKIIESVNIINAGNGYTSAPAITINDNFGIGGAIEVKVSNGAIVGARVTKQGAQYYNRPLLSVDTGSAVLDPILAENALHYYNGLSNAIIEYSNLYGTSADILRTRLENISFQGLIKAGGFVNKNNQFILESSQDKGRVFIPEENIFTVTYTGKPDVEYFYGGIRLTKTSGGYTINGFDNSLAYFKYNKPNTSTGGITTKFTGTANIDVLRYTVFETTISQLDYNTELKTIQEVYDFINGYGYYLNSLGFTQQWRTAAANFVTWAIGSSTVPLTVIPDQSKIIVKDGIDGYFDNIDKKYDGVYNIVNENGKQISSTDLIIDRKSMDPDAETVFQVKDPDTQVFGIRLYKVQLEHAFIFDNLTNFDDVIHDLSIGLNHKRVIWRGSRTRDWNGKLYSPGYIVQSDAVIPNYDTTAREVDQYYGRTNQLSNPQLSDVARFNAGYNKPNWSEGLDIDDDSLYEFTKGTYKYKGTHKALSAFMRNQGLYDGEASAELLEQWAIRLADFGDTSSRRTLEFQLTPELIVTSPQPVRISNDYKFDVLSDLVIDIDKTSPLKVHESTQDNFLTRPINTFKDSSDELFAKDFTTSGLPLLSETDYRTVNKEDFTKFPEQVKEDYDHSGDWQEIQQWDSSKSYKFNEQVLYNGRTWSMLDEDGSSGFSLANNPINLLGTNQLPVIPSTGQTLVIDGNTITLSKTATSSTTNTIVVSGTENISSNVVAHGSTLILGQSSTLTTTVTFVNSQTTTTFNQITKTGTVSNPTIQGSSSATLIIEGTTINFNDTSTTTSNITAQQAFENTFNSSWTTNTGTISSTATTRIARIEALRSAYIAANSQALWSAWINTYFTNNAGLNIDHLLTLINLGGSTLQAATFMLDQDLILINNIKQTNYVGTQVIAGQQTVATSDITDSQAALNNGTFTDDIATYLKSSAGLSTTFATNTVVANQSNTGFITYSLSQIIQEINNASISNVTASAGTSSQLVITKTTNDPTTTFKMTISVGTENNSVGFNTATETINSTSSSVTTTPNLSQQQVIDQINNAGITGVSAQAGATNSNILQLNATLNNLFIGSGTANSTIGLPTGLIPATTTTATSAIGLNITDIVEQINTANISGVSAENSSNRVRLTSTNATLVIGSGTANTTLGFVSQTLSATKSTTSAVFNALVDANGNPVFKEDTNDPNIFSIWVADDSEFGSYNLGYQVYQTMDFGMYTYDICGGQESADEAEIKVKRQTGDVQAHNLSVGDYILIRGSNCIPNIDGIHKVTRIAADRTDKFFIDEFIEINGNTGNIYPLRKMRFSTFVELEANRQVKINNVYKYNFADIRQTNTSAPILAFVDDDGSGQSAVYKWVGTWSDTNGHVGEWKVERTGNVQARNDLLENITLYDAQKQSTITKLETYDPAKGIIFGFVDREIDYKLTNDIANYNYSNIDGAEPRVEAWGREYLGVRWWNTSTAVYLDYEQSTIDYQQNNWGRLFDGASIDIYEWTKSPVLPEQWSDIVSRKLVIDGKEASGEAYSVIIDGQTVYNWTEESYYNELSKQTEVVYYYWIKNKTNSVRNSNYNVLQLSQILSNPSRFNLSWAAQAGNDSLLLANIVNFVNTDTVAQLNQISESKALANQDWIMLAEHDPNITIPEYLHIKMRDSLAGFNRFSVDKTFTTWSSTTAYAKDSVAKEGTNYYLSLVANNTNNQPSADSDMSHWRRIYDYSFIETDQTDNIRIWRGQPVPDLKLHRFNRYGHQIRPRQSLFRDVKEARQNFVHSVNSLLSEVNVIDEINNWENAFSSTFVEGTVTYRVKDYINLVDWHLVEKNNDGVETFRFNPRTVADLVYDTKNDYFNAGEPQFDGTYVYIKSTSPGADIDRSEMYLYTGGVDKLVYKEKATVQISEEMWNQSKFGHGFDAIGFDVTPFDACSDNVISQLLDLLRTEIFIDRHHVKYNKMWFKLLFTAILQNTADDFAFKTTYTHLGVKRPLLIDKSTYQEHSIESVEKFVNSIKPFHTKLLSSMESNTHSEATMIHIDEQERKSTITMKYEDHSFFGREWAGDITLNGGAFSTVFGANVDYSLFTTQQADLQYDYNGNVFVQPVQEGFGRELVAQDFTENISIAVQTMLTPTIDSGHTRSFRMMQYQPMDIQMSNVIVDTEKTTLTANITAIDTTIPVTDNTVLDNPNNLGGNNLVPGVVWIGCERIEYQAIDGNNNLLFCTRGTLGTTAKAHTSGDTVINTGQSTRIPTTEKFSHYGNGLRLAYNDSGYSLTEHVYVPQTPEHAFIKNAGKGTI